jgi:hypothetical protein
VTRHREVWKDSEYLALIMTPNSPRFRQDLHDEVSLMCEPDHLRALMTVSRKQAEGRCELWHPDMMKKTATTKLFKDDKRIKGDADSVWSALMVHAGASESCNCAHAALPSALRE